jgi:hypothetical protein
LSLQAYVDESGGVGQSRAFVMAGFLASVDTWDAFGRDWHRALHRSPELQYFKMHEAVRREGEFARWSIPMRDDRLRELASLITKHKLKEFTAVIDNQAFVAFPLKQMLPKPANSPYFFAFHRIIGILASYLLSIGHTEQFEVFFDAHKIFGHKAKVYYPLIKIIEKNSPKGKLLPVEPIFCDDKETYPLQVADMAAWLLRDTGEGNWHWLMDELEGVELYPHITESPDLLRLAKLGPIQLTAEQQREWQDVLETIQGAQP